MLNMIIISQHMGFLLNMQFSEFDARISSLRINFATMTGTMPMNVSDKGQVVYGGFGRRMLHGCIDPIGWLVGNRGRAVIHCVRTMKNCRPQNKLGTVTIKSH